MKKLFVLFTLFFSLLLFPINSFAKWYNSGITPDGDTVYIDQDLVKKHNNSVYFHILMDHLLPKTKEGTMSWNDYSQFKCDTGEFRFITQKYFKNPMGKGVPFISSNSPSKEFVVLPSSSILSKVGEDLCTGPN